MLEAEQPDGVVVCVGPDFHPKCAIELMDAGYHVYTEKPPATDLDQCRRVLATQQRTGRICMTAFKKRFAPAYVKAKALLADDSHGEPALLSIVRTSGAYGSGDSYLLDSAIHVVDLAAFLCGPVRSVFAVKGPDASYSISLTFAGSAVGTLSLTDRMSYRRGWEQVTLVTTTGLCVQVDNSVEMIAFQYDQPVAAHKPEFVAGSSHSSVEMGFVGELQAFVDAIAEGTTPESSIAQATHTMAVIDAIRASLQTGQPTDVEQI
jgi:predicted dehydrogenase